MVALDMKKVHLFKTGSSRMTIFIKLSIVSSCRKRNCQIICVFIMTKLIVVQSFVWYCSMVAIFTLRGEKNIIVTIC
jgi:hypothetical protein